MSRTNDDHSNIIGSPYLSHLLDKVLNRCSVQLALQRPCDGRILPLWRELCGFCFLRAGIHSLHQIVDRTSVIEGVMTPFVGGDVLLFLETWRLFGCLETTIDVISVTLQSRGTDENLIMSCLRSLKGRCKVERVSMLSPEDSGAITRATDALLTIPGEMESISLPFDEPEENLLHNLRPLWDSFDDGRDHLLDLSNVLCLYGAIGPSHGPFSTLFRSHRLPTVLASAPKLLLKIVCFLRLQDCAEILRRKRIHSAVIAASRGLIGMAEECLQALSAHHEFFDVDTHARLQDDLKAAWTLLFESNRAVGALDGALIALKGMRDVGVNNLQIDMNFSALLVTACESGQLEWICKLHGMIGDSVASHLERLHLTRDFSENSLYLDSVLGFFLSRNRVLDAARVADSAALSSYFVGGATTRRLKLFALAIVSLRSLPPAQAYILSAKSDEPKSRKRSVVGEVTRSRGMTPLHLRTLRDIGSDFVLDFCRSLSNEIPDSICTKDYVFETLMSSNLFHDAFYFSFSIDHSYMLKALFRDYPYSVSPQLADFFTFDSEYGYRSSSLSASHGGQCGADILSMIQRLSIPALKEVLTSCELSLGSLLSMPAIDVVLRALIRRGDILTACKVAAHALGAVKANRLEFYSGLDEIIFMCREHVEFANQGQLKMSYLQLVQAIRDHFLSLVAV